MNVFRKIFKFVKNNIYLLSVIAILALYCAVNLYDIKYKFNGQDGVLKYYICLCIMFFISVIVVGIVTKKTKYLVNIDICKTFVITALLLGVCFINLSPLFTGSDEQNHYYRIYEITDGIFVTPTNKYVGSVLPKSLGESFIVGSGVNTKIKYRNIKSMLDVKLNKSEKTQYGDWIQEEYSNTALYSPVQYLPQVVGFTIGKVFNLNPYIIGMLGRIFNLVFYVILGYFALKIIPTSKMFYLLILLSPNLLQCATTLSADAFTSVIFLLLIALVFRIIYNKEQISSKDKILMFVLSVVISLCKIVYLPIVFVLLMLSSKSFDKGRIEKRKFIIITTIICVAVSLFWMRCTNGVFETFYDKTALQKEFILSNIFEYAIIFFRTISNEFLKFVECLFVGTTMYHSQLKMPSLISCCYIVIVIWSLLSNGTSNKLNKGNRVFLACIAIVIIGLISTAIYIQCTAQYGAVGNPVIGGIQGRYFIPIILLLPFIVNIKKVGNIKNKYLYTNCLIINIITFFYMFAQFVI